MRVRVGGEREWRREQREWWCRRGRMRGMAAVRTLPTGSDRDTLRGAGVCGMAAARFRAAEREACCRGDERV